MTQIARAAPTPFDKKIFFKKHKNFYEKVLTSFLIYEIILLSTGEQTHDERRRNMRLNYANELKKRIDRYSLVRCKDCKYNRGEVNKKGFLICSANGMDITDEDFCSWGERKEKNLKKV